MDLHGSQNKRDYIDSAEAIASRDTSKKVNTLEEQQDVIPELSADREKE
jgi:hypothetical protein